MGQEQPSKNIQKGLTLNQTIKSIETNQDLHQIDSVSEDDLTRDKMKTGLITRKILSPLSDDATAKQEKEGSIKNYYDEESNSDTEPLMLNQPST